MKKKIKDLTYEERQAICNQYVYDNCHHCPFLLSALRSDYYCVKHIISVLESEIETDK